MAAVLVLTMTFMAMLGNLAIPIAAADSRFVADLEVSGIATAPTGELKVRGSYVCPPGYATRGRDAAVAYVFQQAPSGGLDGAQLFGMRILCDGTRNRVGIRVPEAHMEGDFDPDVPLVISLFFVADDDEGPALWADDQETVIGQTLLADIGIGSVEFIEDGAVRVTGSYVCPDGYNVDATFAVISQFIRGPRALRVRHFDRRFVCDGASHDVAVRFQETRSGRPFVPDVLSGVDLGFHATSSNGELLVKAYDQWTLIIQK